MSDKLESIVDNIDHAVVPLLEDLKDLKDAPSDSVTGGIRDVLHVLRLSGTQREYGETIRILSKVMAIENELHRLFLRGKQGCNSINDLNDILDKLGI
jgi:hypothetical protein